MSKLLQITTILITIIISLISCERRSDNTMPKEVATQHHDAISPSGDYVLTVLEHDGESQSFQILDYNTHAVIYTAPEKYQMRDLTYFLWDADDRVWVYSGDLGTFFWEYDGIRQWKMYVYAQSNVSAPPFLKETRPRWHTQ